MYAKYQIITDLPLTSMDPATLATNAQRVVNVTVSNIKDDAYITEEVTDLVKLIDMTLSYPNRQKKNPLTVEMDSLNKDRKGNLSGMMSIVRGWTMTSVGPKVEAALYLQELAGDYSRIKKAPQANASGEFKKFFEKLSGEKAVAAMNLLGVTELSNLMISETDQYETQYQEKISTQETPEKSIDEIQDEIIGHLTSIMKYIDSKAARNSEMFSQAAVEINEISADCNKVIKADKTRSENSNANQTNQQKTDKQKEDKQAGNSE